MEHIAPPPGTWMYKPRSTVTNAKSDITSAFGLMGGIRSIGSQAWHKRYVFFADRAICYGEKLGQKEKVLPVETVKSVSSMTREQVLSRKGPEPHADFGWSMLVDCRETFFCCESDQARNEWVNFIQSLLSAMTGGSRPVDDVSDMVQEQTIAAMMTRQQETERERGPPPPKEAPERGPAPGQPAAADDDVGEEGDPGEVTRKSMKELERLAGGAADDDADVDMNVDDLDESDDENEEEESAAASETALPESQDSKYRRFLIPKAEVTYQHLNSYKIDEYKDLFKKDDSIRNIRFSRAVTKVAKRDNAQDRDLVVTNKYLYLFAKGRITKTNVKVIELDQVVGVIESTLEGNLLALLVPSFHDILVRITPQKSMVGGSEVEVKYQLIAHLYAAHKALNTGRSFIIRAVENVRAVIRRNEDDPYLPLEGRKEDKLSASTNAALFPAFRTNADNIVYFSAMVMRINAERVSRLRGLVVTDAAFYIVSEGLDKVQRRTPLCEVSKLMYDSESHGLLIKCAEVDAFFTVKDPADFALIQRVIPQVAGEAGQTIKCVPSRQLSSQCQLVETRKLIEMFGANNADSLKKGMRLTQKLFRNSWKVSVKGVTTLGNQVTSIGDKGIDFLVSAGKDLTGALVDNAITGAVVGTLGAAGSVFLSQHRFFQERILEFADEEAVLAGAKEPFTDQLRLGGSQQATDLKLGTVGYSSHCDKYNLTATIDAAKTASKAIAVCQAGIYLFDLPNSGGGLFNPLKGLLHLGGSSLKVDDSIDWKAIRGIVQSEKEPNIIGFVLSTDKLSDIMLRIPNGTIASKLISVACHFYIRANSGKRYSRTMLGLWTVPRTENLKISLRKTLFDPPPTIALRYPKHDASGDQLMLAVVEDVAEKIRRFGDNTLLFSALAWRFRSTKLSEAKVDLLKDENSKNNKTLFKSFNLVLTNCAFYQLTKGGYDIVRRTDLREITMVRVTREDPDTMLLVIPTSEDILFRVEGRGREFFARLQDGFVAWTLFGLYLSHEEPNSHQINDFCFPSVACDNLTETGNFCNGKGDDSFERPTEALAQGYREWFRKDVDAHIRRFELAVEAAERGELLDDSIAKSGITVGQGPLQWASVIKSLDNCICGVKFAHSRAFRFGFRGDTVPSMSAAGELMQEWSTVVELARQLTQAIDDEAVVEYESLRDDASSFAALSFLLREQEKVYRGLSKKKVVLVAIEQMLRDTGKPLEDMALELSRCFEDAVAAKVKPAAIAALRRQAQTRLQRERLAGHIQAQLASSAWQASPPASRALLLQAGERLSVDSTVLQQATAAQSPVDISAAALSGVDESISLGEKQPVLEAITALERLSSAGTAVASLVETKIRHAKAQLQILARHDNNVKELEAIRVRVKRTSLVPASKEELAELRRALFVLQKSLTVPDAPILDMHLSVIQLFLDRLRDQLFRLQEQGNQSVREAVAMAEYAAQVKQRAEDERKAQAALQMEEEARAANRRVELVAAWQVRAAKLTKSFEHARKHGDVQFTRQCLRNAAVFTEEIKEMTKGFPDACRTLHREAIDRSLRLLAASSKLGQAVLEKPADAAETEETVRIPDEVLEILERPGQHQRLVAYIQGHHDILNRATIAEIRARWVAAQKQFEWVGTLHKNIHTAFALRNVNLLRAQIDLAKAQSYRDDVVAGAVDVLEVMTREQEESAASARESVQPAAAVPPPKPCLLPLAQVYAADHPVGRLHAAVTELLRDPSNTAGAVDKAKIRVADDTPALRRVVNEWIAVMQHRAKPSGIFRKTERNMLDVLEFIGKIERSGEFVAPYTNRVLSDFDRVKKFNNPQGHSGSYFVVQFMLLKGDLEAVLAEMRRLPPKDLSDVFLDDSLHRVSSVCGDLRLLANMCNQIEWPFDIHERSSFATQSLAERDPSLRGGSIGSQAGSSVANAEIPLPQLRQQNAVKAVAALRRAVQCLSEYFAKTLKALGTCPATDDVKGIFDENANKGIGLVVRDVLCPALSTVLLAGFRSSHFMKKRHLWDLVVALSVRLRESSKALGGVGIPDAVDMVLSITDLTGRNKQALSRLADDQLLDVRWRMFICHCLNQRMLQPLFDALYDNTQEEMLTKFYRTEICLLVPADDECAREVRAVLQFLAALPYVLCIDAEIW